MILEKGDLEQIGKIVEKSADNIKKDLRQEIKETVEKSAQKLDVKLESLDKKIDKTKKELTEVIDVKVGTAKKEILDVLGREITDLADINRAVIATADQSDHRLRIVERRLGIKVG